MDLSLLFNVGEFKMSYYTVFGYVKHNTLHLGFI